MICPGVDRSDAAVKELRKSDPDRRPRHLRFGSPRHARQVGSGPGSAGRLHRSSREPGTASPGPRYVNPEASATGELVYEIAAANGWKLTPLAARALYVAILTDTGAFRFSNTRPHVLRVAAALPRSRSRPGTDLSRRLRQRAGGPGAPAGRDAPRPWSLNGSTDWHGSPCPRVRWSALGPHRMISMASSSSPEHRGRPDGAPVP